MRVADGNAAYAFTGTAIPFEPGGVLALPDDPRAHDHPAGSRERRAMDAVNHTYTSLLAQLDDLVNGHADAAYFQRTLTLMASLASQARAMANATAVPGRVLGPSFEYQPVRPRDDVERA